MVSRAHLCSQCGFGIVQAVPAHDNRTRMRCRLSELDSLIAVLTAERDALQAQSDTIVYPVLSLPPEITSEIFEGSIGIDDSVSITVGQRIMPVVGANTPLLLTHICREWRQIAPSNPALWRSLHLLDTLPPEAVETWLSRAGNLPLAYHMHMQCRSRDEPRVVALAKTSIIHAARWQDAHFSIPPSALPEFNFEEQSLPYLRHLSLAIYHNLGPRLPVTTVTDIAIRNAPLLVDFHLSDLPDGVKLELPWFQLTGLTLKAMALSECLALVAKCPQLQKLEKLQSLRSACSVHSVMAFVTAPRLEALAVDGERFPQDAETITELARRSNSPLQHFTVVLPESVDNLTLDYGRPLIDVLGIFGLLNSADLLPRLKNFTLRCRSRLISPEQHQTFVDLLQTRRSTLKLADVFVMIPRLEPSNMPNKAVIEQLRALALTGMKIRIKIKGTQECAKVAFDSTWCVSHS
ncbi:hypothetical protein FB45DRAFT_1143584 [Roridomyces roridus]|uniref:F-box domain-containing protein n=1 Tax=Roridomyces roridus TaxID=1738132 RepID=A0AAD7C094_9AGAR|nr:hypothetical protein FB45DRAFT_1143584 [Roridomyces roridus]